MQCRSERETNDNNLNSFCAPSGGNRLSDSSILVNPTSGKRRKNQASQIQFPPPLRVNNVIVSRPTQPIVASNFDPSPCEIDRDLLVLKQCYFNQNIPEIPQGLIICESNEDLQQKWLAARKAFNKASDRLEKSESSDPDDDDEDYEETPFADVTTIMSSPQRNMLEKFSEATTKCIPLTLGFAQVDQTWNNVRCPCSGILKGWRDQNDIRISVHELPRCENRTFTPASYMQHVNELSKRCNYHFFLQQYLRILYCDNFGNLRQCVGNPNPLSFDRRRIIWSQINNIDLTCPPISIFPLGRRLHNPDADVLSISSDSDSSSVSSDSSTSLDAWFSATKTTPKQTRFQLPPLKVITNPDVIGEKQRAAITCTMTAEIFTDPVVAYDGYTYEREFIEKWLTDHNTSPFTKEPMTCSELRSNHTVRTMIESYYPDENEPVIPDTVLVKDDPEDIPDIATNPISKATKRPLTLKEQEKVTRRNANEKRSRPFRNALKQYTINLEKGGWFNPANLKNDMPMMPSYSMMLSLDDGYQLVLYSCTHNTDLSKLKVHRNSVLRIILGPNMGTMWHEALLHNASKSRINPTTGETSIDMRLHSYVWQNVTESKKKDTISRSE